MTLRLVRMGLVFLGALVLLTGLFHFCATDRATDSSATHVCTECATTGTALVSTSPTLAIIIVVKALESPTILPARTVNFERITSPREPPGL